MPMLRRLINKKSSRKMMKKENYFCFLVLLFLVIGGCMPQPPAFKPTDAKEGDLLIYLQPLPQEAQLLTFTIASLSAVRLDGTLLPLTLHLNELKGAELVSVQKPLASAVLPPGLYKGISLQIDRATLLGEEGEVDLLVPTERIFVEHDFTVSKNADLTLVLSLSPVKIVTGGFQFTPSFLLLKPNRQLTNLKGFASNSGSNSVTVFNKNTMEVVDRIKTGEEPKGLALDQNKGWLYVALAGEDVIEIIEVINGEIQGRIRLVLGDRPVELALSSDGRTLISANSGSNTVSIINTESLFEEGRISFPSEPSSLIFSSSGTQSYVLQSLANSLSAVSLTKKELGGTVTLTESPDQAVISKDGKKIYVISEFSSDLLVIDPADFSVISRIFIGSGAFSIKLDSKTGLIYVGKTTGEIAVVDSVSLAVIDTFKVDGEAGFLTIDNEENNLFVVLPEKKKIQKLNLVNKKILGTIEVGEGCYDIVVMGER